MIDDSFKGKGDFTVPVLLGVVCLCIAQIAYIKTRFFFNPVTSMFTVWGLILPFSCWGFFKTAVPSGKIYFIVILGLFGFLIGALLGELKVNYSLGTFKKNIRKEYKFNYPLIYCLLVIAIIYYVYQMIIVVGLLASGFDYEYIRRLSTATDFNVLRGSALITVTRAFIATPVSHLSIALLPIELLKKKKRLFVIVGYLIVMGGYVFTTGGRAVMLWFMLYFFVIFLMKSKTSVETIRKILRKYWKWIIIVGGGVIFVFMQITYSRKGEDVDLLKQTYIYFVCHLQNLDVRSEIVDSSGMYGYGLSSFYGLLYPLMFLLQRLRIDVFTPYVLTIYNMSFQDLQVGYDIGGDINMNAFVTAFYQPYLDGRYIGIFFILALFGFVSGRFFLKAYYKNDMKAVLIYILLLQKIVFSFVRFYFTQQAQSICFLLSFFVVVACKSSDDELEAIRF